jgi:2',3'-cyclic-nucleotide 2'-phosphodiesterase (5'-nucleotidase family)
MKTRILSSSALWAFALLVLASSGLRAQFTLQILHASDLEGGVDAIERAPNFAAIVDNLEDDYANSITLSAGDNYIPGPFFSAASDGSIQDVIREVYEVLYDSIPDNNLRTDNGRVDITIMNVLGFDASAVGNHEFDAGSAAFETIIGEQFNSSGTDVRWIGSQFPYLSANLDFTMDDDLSGLFVDSVAENTFYQSNPNTLTQGEKRSLAASTFITRGGEMIGVIGATTPILESITSNGDTQVKEPGAGENDMDDLASILQPYIDQLIMMGMNKIILVTHLQQIALEQELATKLSGVDVIIAGGSDAILANADDRLSTEDAASIFGSYPLLTSNLDGEPVAIVSTNGEYSYVGRLVVEFDALGVIDTSSLSNLINGPYISDSMMVADLYGSLAAGFTLESKGELVTRLIDSVSAIVTEKDANTFGLTDVYLDGRRSQVRTQETNLGNLSADANLWVAQQFDPTVAVSLKNGGGIRAAIGEVVALTDTTSAFLPPQANPLSGKAEGEVSQLDIENTLRFNNALSVLTLSASDLKAVIENGLEEYDGSTTSGAFPQLAGVRVSFDPSRPAGDRIVNLSIVDADGNLIDAIVLNGNIVKNPEREIRIVTLDFLAGGGDGYPFDSLGVDRVDLDTVLLDAGVASFADPGTEQDAIAEYLAAVYGSTPYEEAETPQSEDLRIQILDLRADSVFIGQDCAAALLQAPQNPIATEDLGGNVTISWDPVPSSEACLVRGQQVGFPGVSKVVSGVEPSSLFIPSSSLASGATYNYTVTCACTLEPLAFGPQSAAQSFSISILREAELAFDVKPNPIADNMLRAYIPAEADMVQVVLFDLQGKILLNEEVNSNSWIALDLAQFELASGNYLLQVEADQVISTQSVVIP